MQVAFHENVGNHENEEDSYKQGAECWISRNTTETTEMTKPLMHGAIPSPNVHESQAKKAKQ